MKKIFLPVVLLLALTVVSNAQFKDYKLKLGGQFNMLMPSTDESSMDNSEFSYLGRLFARFELSKSFGLEVGAGFGTLKGEKDQYMRPFETSLLSFGPRLLVYPFDIESLNPYLSVGVEALKWENKDPENWNTENDGIATVFPINIGTEIKLSKSLLLDIAAGYNYSLSDYLYSNDPKHDSYWNLSAGLALSIPSSPADSDGDGLNDDLEEELGTDPYKADTDGDGLNDYDEVNKYNTNPLSADSDNDGLNDGEETNVYKTNPNKADSDGDGLNDGDEVNKYYTKPTEADTDNDGLTDGQEVNTYKTNSLKADTDGEGLNDGEEVNKYKTDPLKADTDGGSIDDKTEIGRGTDPLDPSDDVKKHLLDTPVYLEGIHFDFDKAIIKKEGEKVLNKVIETLKPNPDVKIRIIGYTDNTGPRGYNLELSKKRAEVVKKWFVKHGIKAKNIVTEGKGLSDPVATNKTKEGRAKNRRVEISEID